MAVRQRYIVTISDPDIVNLPRGQNPAARRSFASFRSITALMLREMSTRYGRTPGGYVWAVLEPVGALLVISMVFSILMRSPPMGNSFVLFYASGYLPFTLYANVQGAVQGAISFSKPLLYYPAVSWIDALIARFLLNVLTSVVVAVVVLFGVLQFTSASAILRFGPMVEAMALASLVGFGMGAINCLLVGLIAAWSRIWGIATRPMFLIAGVIFTYESLPDGFRDILWYTPWIHISGIFREGVYPTYEATYVSYTVIFAWGLIPSVLGLMLLRKHYQDILIR